MDLCNNKWGYNKPSNSDLLTVNQMRSVNALWDESRGMREDGTTPEAFLSNETCAGVRLYFIRKDNGDYFA